MSINYNISAEGSFLFVEAFGCDDNLEDVMNYSSAVIEAMNKYNSTRVLCDERKLEYKIGIFDTYKLAENLAEYAPWLGRAAIVFDPKYVEDATFWETVAINRGLQVRVFPDYDEAKKWLEQE